MAQGGIERERKYDLMDAQYELMQSMPNTDRFIISNSGPVRREYIYFDTEEGILYQTGMTLSIRIRPPQKVLTAKKPTHGSTEERLELECAFFDDREFSPGMEVPYHEKVERLGLGAFYGLNPASLRGVLLMDIMNTRLPITSMDHPLENALELSIAKYSGKLDKNGSMITLYEAEVELESGGTLEDLERFTALLQRKYHVSPHSRSKYQKMMDAFGRFKR